MNSEQDYAEDIRQEEPSPEIDLSVTDEPSAQAEAEAQTEAQTEATEERPSTEPISRKEKILTSLLDDDEEQEREVKRLRDVLQTLSINGEWFRRQIGVFVIIALGMIWYVTNRYQAQRELIEEQALIEELQDWKFRSMTRSSELTHRCRQSQLEQWLKAHGDSTLAPATTAPYAIKRGKR